jgi:hypothetical protein
MVFPGKTIAIHPSGIRVKTSIDLSTALLNTIAQSFNSNSTNQMIIRELRKLLDSPLPTPALMPYIKDGLNHPPVLRFNYYMNHET